MPAERPSWWGLGPAALFIVAAGLAGLVGDGTVSSAAATGYGFTEILAALSFMGSPTAGR